jgi:catechol-2,3-dioxygenase
VIAQDPDFYLKVVGMMQQSKNKLQIVIHGNTLAFYLNDKHIGNIGAAEFYKMKPNEIWKTLGVSNEHKKNYLL